MSTFPPKPRSNFKVIGIIIGSIVALGGIGYGTFALLQKVKPTVPFQPGTPSQQQQATTALTADQLRQQAEQLLSDHKLAQAKDAYQKAATAYTAEGNRTAALDANQQVTVVDTAIKAATSTQTGQAPPPKVTGSNNHYQ